MRLLILLALSPVAFAAPPEAFTTPAAVAVQVGAATEQLLVMAPAVRSFELAEALRRAAAERGVQVFLLVSPAFVDAGDSFVPALAVLPNVQTRLALVDRAFVIAGWGEGAFLLEGEWLGENAPAPGARDLYALTDATTVADRSRLFGDVWLAAPAYRSLIERLPFETGGSP